MKNDKKNIIRFLEETASNGHVALNMQQYDGWLLRFSDGYTNRANSVSVLYPSTKDIEEKVRVCEEKYGKQGQPAVFKLTEPDAELNAYLEERGYQIVTPSYVMMKKLEKDDVSMDSFVFSEEPSEEWIKAFFRYEGIADRKKQETFRRMLDKVMVDTVYCSMVQNGEVTACAAGAAELGWMLLQYVVVSPEHRGKGYGRHICRALNRKAGESGVEYSYLQVVKSNQAALNLYRNLGYEHVYEYWYMRQPAEKR